MSNVRCINYWDLCRICTASSEQKINIYSADGRAKNLSQKIAECLPVQIDEKDGLPKVVCAQCAHQVEQMHEMRNISMNSQTILRNWLNHRTLQTDTDKVFIKDAINDAGKSLNVVGTLPSGGLVPASHNQSNDLLSSIMQAVGMQVQQQQQQYTITVDSHVQAQPLPPPLPQHTQSTQGDIKSEKQNTLEEFIRLKPDIKITPLGKKENQHSTVGSSSMTSIKQQQLQQQQHAQQQLPTQTLTAVPAPAPAAQIQLQPQQLNELNVLLQQQALLQQLQQLQSQTQAQFTSCADDGMGNADKKPKLNFVLSSPAAAPQFAGSLQQFAGIGGTQPQIQLQLMPGGGVSTSNATGVQTTQPFNAAALLSSLTGTQVVGTGTGAANMLSPNKCFLPITIRDENSDQQIVAHIDTKNLVLPTTYQVQMKLQPQLATADGQPIMQLTPTSIPATLQLTPQQNQFLLPQPQPQQQQHQPQKQHQQQQHQLVPQQQPAQQQQTQQPQAQQQQQSPQQLAPTTAQVTSQQIIRSPRTNPLNSQLVIRNVSSEPSTPKSSNADATVKFKTPSSRQQPQQQQQLKYKTTPPSVTSNASTVPAAAVPSTLANTRVALVKQQQPTVAPNNVAALQRLSSNTTITKLTKPQQPVTNHKMPLLNKQNITISRISTQAAPKAEVKPAPAAAPPPAQIPAAPKPQVTPAQTPQVPPVLTLQQQQLPQPVPNIANQRKIIRKPPETQPNQRSKIARPQQQILPVPAHQAATSPQQQQQQQVVNSNETTTGTPASALTCPTCRREFKKKEHLTQHVKLHAGLRPFKCTEEGCDKAFSRKEHLSRHLVSHSGQKMFTCEDCKKPFSRKDNLNKHKRTHSAQPGETRLHSCDICNKNFASKQHYEKHREMHKKSRLDTTAPTTQTTAGVQQAGKAQVFEAKPTVAATPQTQTQPQPAQSQIQIQQQQPQQHQPQIMHVDLDGSTITITQASDSNMQTSLANYVQLGFSQFQNTSGPTSQLVCKLEK